MLLAVVYNKLSMSFKLGKIRRMISRKKIAFLSFLFCFNNS